MYITVYNTHTYIIHTVYDAKMKIKEPVTLPERAVLLTRLLIPLDKDGYYTQDAGL